MEIPVDDLNKDTGMTTLLEKLDTLFLKEEKDRAYEAYTNFDRIMRDCSVQMADYIIDFEQRYSRLLKYNIELPDAVLAFKLLDTACLDTKDRQLALTACADLKFTSMKSALNRIFGGKPQTASSVGIKHESAYVTEQTRLRGKSWPQKDQQKTPVPGTNPLDRHLHSEHSYGDRSIAQWKVQQDNVQCMESQLILEKQKLIAMQLHLHLSEHKYTDLAASEWPYSLPLFLPQPQVTDGDRVQQWDIKHLEEFYQHGYRAAGSAHLCPDMVPSIECYKYNNIRPPYTYAYLIRWSILESPDKQCTLNEIYNWFTAMFFYFRHNTATWKNAVRHNLSLHKCFVRVEGGKGAVWTVDETEYQRRKGQKYHRDCPVKWLTSYPHYCPEDP